MSSSTSSSDARNSGPPADWRRFFRLAAGSAVAFAAVIYLFVVVVDPWGVLPLSPPFDRAPVTSNQRFSYPMLARSPAFDSAVIGTSTSRLLRPEALDPAFDARFVNLAMNDATVFEMSGIFAIFRRAHPQPKIVVFGLDYPWCVTGDSYEKLTPRPFPAWMYGRNPWRGYGEMFNLFAVQEAGKEFGVLTGLKRPDMGRDGYTRFVPPDSQYDPVRAAAHLREYGVSVPGGERAGAPETWRYPALEVLHDDLSRLPADTSRILFFVPYNHRMLSPPGSDSAVVWNECKRRAAGMARALPRTGVVDFLLPSPITSDDDNYWDGMHYRVSVADRLARDLTAATRGEASADYRLLSGPAEP
jgi:hypothetical protein